MAACEDVAAVEPASARLCPRRKRLYICVLCAIAVAVGHEKSPLGKIRKGLRKCSGAAVIGVKLPLVRVVKDNVPYAAFCVWTAAAAAVRIAPSAVTSRAPLVKPLSGCLWHQLALLSLDAIVNVRAGAFHRWWANGKYERKLTEQGPGHAGSAAAPAAPGASNESEAARLARTFSRQIAVMQDMLDEEGIQLPKSRRQPPQLLRFAAAHGLLTAKTSAEEVRALRAATEHTRLHIRWLATVPFLKASELRPWQRYCSVRGVHNGCIVLQLRLGAFIRERPLSEHEEYARVIVSMIELLTRKLMRDDGTRPSQLVALLHVGEVSIRNSLAFTRLGSRLATALHQNYPARLAQLYVVDLPTSALWFAKSVMRFVGPATRRKVVMCSASAPELPAAFEPVQGVRSRNGADVATASNSDVRRRRGMGAWRRSASMALTRGASMALTRTGAVAAPMPTPAEDGNESGEDEQEALTLWTTGSGSATLASPRSPDTLTDGTRSPDESDAEAANIGGLTGGSIKPLRMLRQASTVVASRFVHRGTSPRRSGAVLPGELPPPPVPARGVNVQPLVHSTEDARRPSEQQAGDVATAPVAHVSLPGVQTMEDLILIGALLLVLWVAQLQLPVVTQLQLPS